jgi:hypothetical protein
MACRNRGLKPLLQSIFDAPEPAPGILLSLAKYRDAGRHFGRSGFTSDMLENLSGTNPDLPSDRVTLFREAP